MIKKDRGRIMFKIVDYTAIDLILVYYKQMNLKKKLMTGIRSKHLV